MNTYLFPRDVLFGADETVLCMAIVTQQLEIKDFS